MSGLYMYLHVSNQHYAGGMSSPDKCSSFLKQNRVSAKDSRCHDILCLMSSMIPSMNPSMIPWFWKLQGLTYLFLHDLLNDMTIFNDEIAVGGMTRVKVIEIEVTLSPEYKDAVKINHLCTVSKVFLQYLYLIRPNWYFFNVTLYN